LIQQAGFGALGSKLSRSLDRMTNGKTWVLCDTFLTADELNGPPRHSVDSSSTYFEALLRFGWECQVIGEKGGVRAALWNFPMLNVVITRIAVQINT
jgi:hypothetical protein